jgi:ubiquinone biosynthesis protein
MDLLALPVVAAISFLTALVFGLAAQRLLGIRLGLVRLLIAGVCALFVNWPIQARPARRLCTTRADPCRGRTGAVLRPAGDGLHGTGLDGLSGGDRGLFPLGSLPPPLVWGRGLRARLARARRYWQIVGVAMRHGLGPFLRDTRRRDDGAGRDRQIGRALRKTLDAGGVTFVKLGQVLSTRRDLLPAEVATS